MRSKPGWITFLICVNLAFITAIVFAATSPPAAVAQGTSLAGNYLIVAGQIQDRHDALYLIDLRERTLHVFEFDRSQNQLMYRDFRELERDFRHNKD